MTNAFVLDDSSDSTTSDSFAESSFETAPPAAAALTTTTAFGGNSDSFAESSFETPAAAALTTTTAESSEPEPPEATGAAAGTLTATAFGGNKFGNKKLKFTSKYYFTKTDGDLLLKKVNVNDGQLVEVSKSKSKVGVYGLLEDKENGKKGFLSSSRSLLKSPLLKSSRSLLKQLKNQNSQFYFVGKGLSNLKSKELRKVKFYPGVAHAAHGPKKLACFLDREDDDENKKGVEYFDFKKDVLMLGVQDVDVADVVENLEGLVNSVGNAAFVDATWVFDVFGNVDKKWGNNVQVWVGKVVPQIDHSLSNVSPQIDHSLSNVSAYSTVHRKHVPVV